MLKEGALSIYSITEESFSAENKPYRILCNLQSPNRSYIHVMDMRYPTDKVVSILFMEQNDYEKE